MNKPAQSINSPKKGMSRKNPIDLEPSEYSFAFNANIENSSEDFFSLSNEQSNILATRFKEGYRFIGGKNDTSTDDTYVFLVNPTTGVGELGTIRNNQNNSDIADIDVTCEDCQKYKVLSEPLEETTQVPLQQYETLLNDACNLGFGFDINFPIKKIVIKNEKCGKTIYFTDFNNPPRYIIIDKIGDYINSQNIVCGEPQGDVICFNADKMRIFKKFGVPTLTPFAIQLGGRLKTGTYEFLIAYSDASGNEISEYFSITNTIPIFDENDIVKEANTELSSITNFAIRLSVTGLDKSYDYYKIVVIQNTDNAENYFVEGIHTIDDNSVIYTTSERKDRIDFTAIIKQNPIIKKAEGLTDSNNTLFLYGLETEKEWNLQPVVSLMGSFFQWQTSIAKEGLYQSGIAASQFRGYNRDETYPLALRFLTNDGYYTANFPLIGRESTVLDRTEINNQDRASIEASVANCIIQGRTQRWQYYNDAIETGTCLTENIETNTVIEQQKKFCTVESVVVIPAGTLTIENPDDYTNLKDFIEDNKDDCEEYDYCDYFNISDYSDQNCTPVFTDNCGEPELADEILLVNNVMGELVNKIPKSFPDEYVKIRTTPSCSMFTVKPAGGYERDTDFEQQYMPGGDTVYLRNFASPNTQCSYADQLQNIQTIDEPTESYFHMYYGADTLAGVLTSKDAGCDSVYGAGTFYDKIHEGGLWFKSGFQTQDSLIFEVSKYKLNETDDNIDINGADNGAKIRLNIFNKCSSTTPLYCQIIDLRQGTQIKITKSGADVLFEDSNNVVTTVTGFIGNDFYAVLDTPIASGINAASDPFYRTAPTRGCFNVVTRSIEIARIDVSYDSITLDKKQTYVSDCEYQIPIIQDCTAFPYKKGDFGYSESTDTYPDNAELYNSKSLKIDVSDFQDSEIRLQFEQKFTTGYSEGKYLLKNSTDFRCQPIRHFKMPDNKVAPFMWDDRLAPFAPTVIYPLGITVNENVITSFLDIAVKNNLITQQQRDSIVGYEVLRGDRTANKSVEASGYLFDMRKYMEEGNTKYYPNYPYNDLGNDKLNYVENRTALLPHNSNSNYNFTFHSPETDFYKRTIPTELKVEGYMFGKSKGNFAPVKDHPKWVILGRKAKTVATLLAGLESAAELAIKLAAAGENFRFQVGVSNSSNPIGIGLSIAAASLGGLEAVAITGRYRYEWLKAFRDLGSPKNFAYYYASEGYYNYIQALQEEGNLVRGLNVGKNLKEGNFTTVNDVTGEKLNINNLDRERSVFISLGEDYPLVWEDQYKEYDNGNIDFNSSSLTFASESGIDKAGKSVDIFKNIASPYVKLKNYIAAQYGTLGSITWISTGYRGDLKNPSDSCISIFGGDTFITRYYIKRKLPLFSVDAMGTASLTPFDYRKYNNIGIQPRFFVDYELGGSTSSGAAIFPDFDSEYRFDSLRGERDMYIQEPSKFYLYYYGIPGMMVETEINTDYREARKEPENNFYPNVGDYMDFTQERDVSIKKPNTFFYNPVYSKNTTSLGYRGLPSTYEKELYDCRFDSPNGVRYSLPDNSENNLSDPWLIYRPLDTYEFKTSFGKLKELRGIESEQVLARFENTTAIFNAVDVLVDGITPSTQSLGTGGIFARRPITFSNTELGYGGTQSSQSISNEFGHFHVDAKRGQVMQIENSGKGMKEISGYDQGMRNWFKEHLPFKILKYFPDVDTDNAYNGIGISMGFDSRFNRVFITKKDYVPLDDKCIEYTPTGFVVNDTECNDTPQILTCPIGYTLNTETNTCEKTVLSPACPSGYSFNTGTQLCERTTGDCSEGLDIVFVLDATASQGGTIDNIKNAISSDIVPAIIENFGADYRLSLIVIRDQRGDGQFLFEILEPFSLGNETTFLTQINTVSAAFGAGNPEPSDLALAAALDNSPALDKNGTVVSATTIGVFRENAAKAIIFTTDERPSGFDDAYDFSDWLNADAQATKANNMGVKIFSYFTGNNTVIPPVPPVGITPPNNTYIMQNYASVTGGTYYFKPFGIDISDSVVDAIVNGVGCTETAQPNCEDSCVRDEDICECTQTTEPVLNDVIIPIDITDPEYFKEVSFTIAYSPILNQWISFYSFAPNYYINHQNYFQTGINSIGSDKGLWSHLLTNQSYQVFYGVKQPFIIDYTTKTVLGEKNLDSLSFNSNTRRYHGKYDWAELQNKPFSSLVIYNNLSNTGKLELVNNSGAASLISKYPKTSDDKNTQQILATYKNDNWFINYFYNRVLNSDTNNPLWIWDANQINKTINSDIVKFGGKKILEKMKGLYFNIRLTQDQESRYQYIYRFGVTQEKTEQ